jgi:hypothetical protein
MFDGKDASERLNGSKSSFPDRLAVTIDHVLDACIHEQARHPGFRRGDPGVAKTLVLL